MDDFAELRIDFLILADRVESINGKLYMMGGAWDNYTLDPRAPAARFGAAVAVLVPWSATNTEHQLQLRIDNADGETVMPSMSIDFKVGRPSNLVPGTEQRVIWALNGDFALPGPGLYTLIATIDGEDHYRTSFRLNATPPG